MLPSSTVHGGQHDIKCLTFESLLHAAVVVADEIWGGMLELACMCMLYGPREDTKTRRNHTERLPYHSHDDGPQRYEIPPDTWYI